MVIPLYPAVRAKQGRMQGRGQGTHGGYTRGYTRGGTLKAGCVQGYTVVNQSEEGAGARLKPEGRQSALG